MAGAPQVVGGSQFHGIERLQAEEPVTMAWELRFRIGKPFVDTRVVIPAHDLPSENCAPANQRPHPSTGSLAIRFSQLPAHHLPYVVVVLEGSFWAFRSTAAPRVIRGVNYPLLAIR